MHTLEETDPELGQSHTRTHSNWPIDYETIMFVFLLHDLLGEGRLDALKHFTFQLAAT